MGAEPRRAQAGDSRRVNLFKLYLKLISARVRSQMQYRASFLLDVLSSGFLNVIDLIALAAALTRFGSVGGWTFGELAFLYGLSDSAFAAMDMIFSGYDPGYFGQQIRKGQFDQFLLRPLSLILQMFSAEFIMRRVGRIAQSLLAFGLGLALSHIDWTWAKLAYLPLVWVSAVAFYGALFVIGATFCFWTTESIEIINVFTYGGTTMMSYPLHIYQEWMQRFFTFVIPTALIIYYPALYFFGKADPTGLLPIAQFVAPVAGFGMLAIAFGVWRIGVRHYQGTGT